MLRVCTSVIRLRAPLGRVGPSGNIRIMRLQALHTTTRRSNAVGDSHRGAEQETREIIALDNLLRLVRTYRMTASPSSALTLSSVEQRSDPAARE